MPARHGFLLGGLLLTMVVLLGLFVAAPAAAQQEDACSACHQVLGDQAARLVEEWKGSVHARQGIGCADCHGGDPRAKDLAQAMSPQAGFIGVPAKKDIPVVCGSCHSDVKRMRQYSIPTDQWQQYRESVHGQLLAGGDSNVATCADCHGAHNVRDRKDPRSPVYANNVPATCARCHANADLMRRYSIPTDQYAQYQSSVHGRLLLEKQDWRAPNCATCHGTHGATPPGVNEVANVCGQCHSAIEKFVLAGRHKGAAGGTSLVPRCVTCHGEHDVAKPGLEMYMSTSPGGCLSCHQNQRGRVEPLYQTLAAVEESYGRASEAVDRAEKQRMLVAPHKEKLQEAMAGVVEAKALQHTVDLAKVEEKTKNAIKISLEVKAAAEKAINEMLFRRKAMVIAVGLILLTIILLWQIKRELMRELAARRR